MYITRFETSAFRPLATFEEDIDVTSGTEHGVHIVGDSLATWKEETLQLRSSNRGNTSSSQENQAVTLGWNNRIAGADTTMHGPPAQYTLELPSGLATSWGLSGSFTLDFMLGPTNSTPRPRKDPAAAENEENEDEDPEAVDAEDENESQDENENGDEDASADEDPAIDLSIEIEDASGHKARVRLGDYGAIRRPLETYIMRRADREASRFQRHWELILQTFSIPLGDFVAQNSSLALGRLTAVRFVFDRIHAGEVSIDQIGFSDLDPAFLGARVDGP